MYWYWSLAAFLLAILIISLVGRLTRYYIGVKMMELLDQGLLRVPLLNKIYGTIKQVNEAFTSNKSSFKQVVLVEFPQPGHRAVGFVTGEQAGPFERDNKKTVSVFIPTTPNPTSGFLVIVPENHVTKLDMSVADGIKFIVSLGAIPPEPAVGARHSLPGIEVGGQVGAPANRLGLGLGPKDGLGKQDDCVTGDKQDACPTGHG